MSSPSPLPFPFSAVVSSYTSAIPAFFHLRFTFHILNSQFSSPHFFTHPFIILQPPNPPSSSWYFPLYPLPHPSPVFLVVFTFNVIVRTPPPPSQCNLSWINVFPFLFFFFSLGSPLRLTSMILIHFQLIIKGISLEYGSVCFSSSS